ncbi:MAG TPA: hypothetical protein DDX71_00215 [Ruminococcus sp.]|nr:hypothetical protein [Ruminococcus sp.]
METIRIRHIPKCVDIAMVVLLAAGFGVHLEAITSGQISAVIAEAAVFAVFITGVILALTVKTKIQFGENSGIQCRWLFLRWKIDLEKLQTVTYTVSSYRTRGGGTSYIFLLRFYEDCKHPEKAGRLKEHLEQRVAEDCIREKYDRVQLMKLYRYIEEQYPEKAKGNE